MNKFFVFLFFILILTGVVFSLKQKNYDAEDIAANLDAAIVQAKEQGNYKCCIDPGCRMCYLGNWKFEKGTCFCDEAIKKGDFDSVCPECKKGLEEGSCSSIKEECEL